MKKKSLYDFSLKKGTVCIIQVQYGRKKHFSKDVAVNYILAMIGAPVCAYEMNFLPVKPFYEYAHNGFTFQTMNHIFMLNSEDFLF